MTDRSRSGFAASRHAGDVVEAAVIQSIEGLEHVPDTNIEYADARVASSVVGIGDRALARGTLVEIKSAMVVYGADQTPGRFYLRETQHDRLVDTEGVYLFAVCTPDPSRDVLVMRALPANEVSELVTSWYDGGDRTDYTQIYWDTIVDPAEVEEGSR